MIRNSRRVVALAIAGAVATAPVLSGCGAGTEPQSAAPTQLTEGVNASVPKGATPAQVDVRNMFLLGPKPETTFGSGSSVPLYAALINQVKGRQDRLVAVRAPDFAQVKITGGAVVLPPAKPSGEGTMVTLVGDTAAASATPSAGATPGATPSGTAKPDDKKTAKPGEKPSGQPSETATPSETGSQPSETATPQAPAESGAPSGDTASPATPAEATPAIPAGKAPLVVLTGLNKTLRGGETLKVTLQFEAAGAIELSIPVVPQQGEYAGYTAVSTGTPVPGASTSPSGEPAEGGSHAPTTGGATGGH